MLSNIQRVSMTEQYRFDTLYDSLTVDKELIHVGFLLRRAVLKWPNRIILICQDESITYRDLYIRSCLMAKRLIDKGVKRTDRVIIFYENSIEFYIAYFGVWHMGALAAPLNIFLHEAELTHIIADATPAALIVSPDLASKLDNYPKDKLPPLITDIDKTTPLPDEIPDVPIGSRDVDDTAVILYTSGTTGFPKGVMLSSRNIIVNAVQGIARFAFTEEERVYCALPLFHSLPQNTCMWANTIVGAAAIIVPKIDRSNLLNGLKHKPTLVVGIPALYGIFSLMRTVEFGHVRYFFSGGDALSNKIRSAFELLYRRKLCNGYGLTESSPFISVDIDDFTQATNTVGKPFVGISCSIRDDVGNELALGNIGTLWVKGDNIMKGYYNTPQATAAVLHNGWLNTGDLAYIDNNGKIVLAGRQRDLIINKGLKIYPQEIENLLLSHPQVTQAAVVGFKLHEEETPVAFVASRERNQQELIRELKQLCQNNLAPYKVPRQFIVKRELPITATGKVDKKQLKAELIPSNTP
jgi:long-chain acyl-CoA synthetase